MKWLPWVDDASSAVLLLLNVVTTFSLLDWWWVMWFCWDWCKRMRWDEEDVGSSTTSVPRPRPKPRSSAFGLFMRSSHASQSQITTRTYRSRDAASSTLALINFISSIFKAHSTQFSMAEILNYRRCDWNDHDADSETGNVSARHAALKRWTSTDKRWNRNAVSWGSIVTSVKRLPICARNSWVMTFTRSSVFKCCRCSSKFINRFWVSFINSFTATMFTVQSSRGKWVNQAVKICFCLGVTSRRRGFLRAHIAQDTAISWL